MTRPSIDLRTAFASIVVLALTGCPKNNAGTTPDTDRGPAPLAKKVGISWGIQQVADAADLYLALTDETGKVASHELGRFGGTCSPSNPSPGMNAITAVTCRHGGTGTEVHAVTQGGDTIIVLRMTIDEGVEPDPMAREEVKRIKIPLGAAIEVMPVISTTGAPGR